VRARRQDQEGSDPSAAWPAVAPGAAAGPELMGRLFPLVYDELRRVAHRQLGAEPTGHTLSTTAVVHEAYLKLAGQSRAQWRDRGQFFAVAAVAMRRILVDYARRHRAARRGGGRAPLALDALDALNVDTGAGDRHGAGGEVAAEARAVTARTVRRDWVKAQAWLYEELRRELA
jgi:RNA polymerase sigma factor (TIGR02999 family)